MKDGEEILPERFQYPAQLLRLVEIGVQAATLSLR